MGCLVNLLVILLEAPSILDGFQTNAAAEYGGGAISVEAENYGPDYYDRLLLGAITLLAEDDLNCMTLLERNSRPRPGMGH